MPADPMHQPAYAAAGRRVLDVMQAVLRPWQLEGPALVHAIRAARVVVHGFASLEAVGGFGLPVDLEETYERLIRMFVATLPAL